MAYRNTILEINLNNLKYNVNYLINKYDQYKYHFAVVKANSYNHGVNAIKTIINCGIDYLCVATLSEALEIREFNREIPILCLGVIPSIHLNKCFENNITITINSLDYLNEVIESCKEKLKVHIKINTGMNRLGINNKEDFNKCIKLLNENGYLVEGVYTHIYDASSEYNTMKQYLEFQNIISDVNLSKIKYIHLSASEATELYDKADFANACRFGIIMYGIININKNLLSTFKIYSEVIEINKIKKGETIGYNGIYKCDKDELIAVIPIGYDDGIIRKNTGRYVYINDKKYPIVGNICMDMLFVKIDKSVKLHDKVYIIKDNDHLNYISKYLDTIPYEVMCLINKRVERDYIDE